MKKIKLLGLVATMLLVAMLLAACSTGVKLEEVYNPDYDTNDKVFTTATEISALEDYEFVTSNSNFAVFAYADDENETTETVVYSFLKGDVVLSLTADDEDEAYAVNFVDGTPVFYVDYTAFADPEDEESEDEVERTYYDAIGTVLTSLDPKYEIAAPRIVTEKMVIINAVMYNVDVVTGALTMKAAVPAYVAYDNIMNYNDEYFYAATSTAVIIYDLDFKPIAIYSAPSYAEVFSENYVLNNGVHVLNNGDVLIQYRVELDEDAKKFDFYEDETKYDLVSVILNTEGEIKELNLDYVVAVVNTNADLYDETKTAAENAYVEGFENIAYIYRIEDQKIDYSYVNMDIVLMNNAAKAEDSLKLVAGQTSEMRKVAADLYEADTVYGKALFNAEGEVLFAVTEDYEAIVGNYILTDRAIYDMNFNLVYDLIANEASVMNYFGNTIFVKEGDDAEYSLKIFNAANNGYEIYSYDAEAKHNDVFGFFGNIGYYVASEDYDEFTYYNAAGEVLLDTEEALQFVASSDNKQIYKFSEVDKKGEVTTIYYAFAK